MRFRSPILLLLTSFIWSVIPFQQLHGQCPSGIDNSSGACETAFVSCLQDACYLTASNFGGAPFNGWCGSNTAVHNPQYFAFIATGDFVQINILVNSCDNGQGLQSAILGTCPWTIADVITCNPGTNEGGTMILQSGGFTPGQTYYVIVDGSGGALCSYTFEFTAGIISPQMEVLDTTQVSLNPSSLCPGNTLVTLHVDTDTTVIQGYTITYEWNSETFVGTNSITQLIIPSDAPPGTWDICIRPFSGCDTSEYVICKELTIYEDLPMLSINGDSSLCASLDDMQYGWHRCFNQTTLSNDQCFTPSIPGCYCVDVTSIDGCVNTACFDMLVATSNVDQQIRLEVNTTGPANEFHIEINDLNSLPIHWMMVDHQGRICEKGNIQNAIADIQFHQDLPAGLYFLQFQNQQNAFAVRKMIIQ